MVAKDSFVTQKKRSDSAITHALSEESDLPFDKDEEMQNDEDLQEEEAQEVFLSTSTLDANEHGKETQNGGRKIPNCCAICLCAYDVDDSIFWSNNKECIHAFHDECILNYLQGQKKTPCPCCRRDFTDMLPKGETRPNENGVEIENENEGRGGARTLFVRLVHRVRYSSVSERD